MMKLFCFPRSGNSREVKLVLEEKGIPYEKLNIREEAVKESEDFKKASPTQKVPAIIDGDVYMDEAYDICEYLEDKYPESPGLFSNTSTRALTRIFNHWFDKLVTLKLFPLVVPDNFDVVCPEDLQYYTESRFLWLGKTRNELAAERNEDDFTEWRQSMDPLREQLQEQDFLGGETPLFADYIVFSMFMWARAVSPWPVILPGDVLYPWRERMLDLHDGLARKSKGYDY